jgi:hypothetical protein
MPTITLTDAEIAFLLKQPDVANTLARFNKAQAMQSACLSARMDYLDRVRTFEKIEQRRLGPRAAIFGL